MRLKVWGRMKHECDWVPGSPVRCKTLWKQGKLYFETAMGKSSD